MGLKKETREQELRRQIAETKQVIHEAMCDGENHLGYDRALRELQDELEIEMKKDQLISSFIGDARDDKDRLEVEIQKLLEDYANLYDVKVQSISLANRYETLGMTMADIKVQIEVAI